MSLKSVRVTLRLDAFFPDHRSVSRILINGAMKTVADLQAHVQKIFGIQDFYLSCNDHFLPAAESVELLERDDVIHANPIQVTDKREKSKKKKSRVSETVEECCTTAVSNGEINASLLTNSTGIIKKKRKSRKRDKPQKKLLDINGWRGEEEEQTIDSSSPVFINKEADERMAYKATSKILEDKQSNNSLVPNNPAKKGVLAPKPFDLETRTSDSIISPTGDEREPETSDTDDSDKNVQASSCSNDPSQASVVGPNRFDPYKRQLLIKPYTPVRQMEISTVPKIIKPIFVNGSSAASNSAVANDDNSNSSSSDDTKGDCSDKPETPLHNNNHSETSDLLLSTIARFMGGCASQLNDTQCSAEPMDNLSITEGIPKRKRVRKRKRKAPITKESEPLPRPNSIRSTNTFIRKSSPANHIRFGDGEDNEGIANEQATGNELTETSVSPSGAEQEVEAGDGTAKILNANDMCEENKSVAGMEMIMSRTTDLPKTNLVTDRGESFAEKSPIETIRVKDPFDVENLKKYPVMTNILPKEGDIVAFKILRISEDTTPVVSSNIIAKVGRCADYNNIAFDILQGEDQCCNQPGRLYTENETASASNVAFAWSHLIEPRLLYP